MKAGKAYDLAVVGGGLIGLATARALLERFPGASLLVLEKEDAVARHQSGRSSGVLHSGIYYKAGSLKSDLTARGQKMMLEYCTAHNIHYELCGKVILASREDDLSRLEALMQRGLDNQLDVKLIDSGELKGIEPHAKAIQALWIPQAGIVDYRAVAGKMAEDLRALGGAIQFGAKVLGVSDRSDAVTLKTTAGKIQAGFVVNCAGLFSDRIARMAGVDPGLRIIPFRGEYFRLRPEARHFVRGLIYPLPDPDYPFLGVHLTRMTDGEVLVGPNAVFSFMREGYEATDVSLRDTLDSLTYSGFWKLVLPSIGTGLGEMTRSWSVAAFTRAIQNLVPEIQQADLLGTRSGVRAQAVDQDGTLVEDFHFAKGQCWLHVLNAPSPGATASLAIGEYVAGQVHI
ncbi:MAG: L-2-hydroxyglutarate oxidase [Anaerolineales bacterium]